jgi:hypothetical protein
MSVQRDSKLRPQAVVSVTGKLGRIAAPTLPAKPADHLSSSDRDGRGTKNDVIVVLDV